MTETIFVTGVVIANGIEDTDGECDLDVETYDYDQ